MRLLRYMAGIFINTFGITNPSEKDRDRAALYIAFLLALVVIVLCSAVAIGVHFSR